MLRSAFGVESNSGSLGRPVSDGRGPVCLSLEDVIGTTGPLDSGGLRTRAGAQRVATMNNRGNGYTARPSGSSGYASSSRDRYAARNRARSASPSPSRTGRRPVLRTHSRTGWAVSAGPTPSGERAGLSSTWTYSVDQMSMVEARPASQGVVRERVHDRRLAQRSPQRGRPERATIRTTRCEHFAHQPVRRRMPAHRHLYSEAPAGGESLDKPRDQCCVVVHPMQGGI